MPDETSAILEIMRVVGVYDFVMDRVKDQTEAVELFKDGFQPLVSLCQKRKGPSGCGAWKGPRGETE